ncbi:protein kinase domain-containing protein [Haematococcus lacustris]|uniref:Protein kinase domain-containing protein n=1 Tax=Haematococcus lacustris TaxID=44745 RepID=A0A699YH30_HAELA|nr:protein kinase domain-containing protein [Haematococcus lacustris]
MLGKQCPLRRESEINARFHRVVGSGVANVVNACIQQKHPSWKQLLFDISSDPSDGSGWPDFLIQQLRNDRFEVDVCGGEGESPDVMTKQIIDLTKMHEAVADALMQACSYCQEKGWRFTFITSYQYTFFIWRVAENRYAVTNGLIHDVAPFDLYTREVLAYIMWMSLEAPWGKQLPPGELRDLEYPLADLKLDKKSLGSGQCGSVMKGWLRGVPVAVKVTDACKQPYIVERLWHEAQIYGHLLPVLHGCGYWRGRNSFFLATAVVPGHTIDDCTDEVADGLGSAIAQAARQALQAIHQRGVAHGDVRANNILVQHRGNTLKVIFIDFGHAHLHPTLEECKRELKELDQELRYYLN